eukprot:TRINITY_DN11445_c0_g1_i1.p1 TRINITY_DN11445_c0_g1~~TRINITY_DN11445_c0_g1_i1.p1  ORF type:complete len:207 (+),score=100.12 TRINITY_DN11445_c0_g1_i1:107-727(+)
MDHRYYQVLKTTFQMLNDRGYSLPDKYLEDFKYATFLSDFGAFVSGLSEERADLTRLCDKIHNPNNGSEVSVYCSPSATSKLKSEQIDTVARATNRAIIIVGCDPSSQAKSKASQMRSEGKYIEFFLDEELMVNITRHELVPQHVLLTQEETDALLQRYKLEKTQLPRILVTDPVAKYFGMEEGEVVKIIRKSQTAGKYITYRLVM